jgi:hypothetical protein
MAQGLAEVRASLPRVLALARPGPARGQLARSAGLIDQGLAAVQEGQERVKRQAEAAAAVAGLLDRQSGTLNGNGGGATGVCWGSTRGKPESSTGGRPG